MQLMMLYAQSGHIAWTGDDVLPEHLLRLARKLDTHFHVTRLAHQRAYYKGRGEASVHIIALPGDGQIRWVLMSTRGRHGLLDRAAALPGPVRDVRTRGENLRWGRYELFRMQKRFHLGTTETGTDETWSWRLAPAEFRAYEAILVERAKMRDRAAHAAQLERLRALPMFAGVRAQVARLTWEAAKTWNKFNPSLPQLPSSSSLPIMTRMPVYASPPQTLLHLIAARDGHGFSNVGTKVDAMTDEGPRA
ncbi:hypothetical protein WI23_02755 [Burkholderia oklahomensis C6786]|nr:hypothetical protein WI23_02755 [Burkholderia oklahomensis C6786]KUY65278.1 hypothetical protein WI23_04325 [Burkholderia oklahomensis C6786]